MAIILLDGWTLPEELVGAGMSGGPQPNIDALSPGEVVSIMIEDCIHGLDTNERKAIELMFKESVYGIAEIKPGRSPEIIPFEDSFTPATGPYVLVKGKVLKAVCGFEKGFLGLKWALADVCSRAAMLGFHTARIVHPQLRFSKLPLDIFESQDFQTYKKIWPS
jgi:hypothetical protein